jgi:hypothetical protein
MKAFDFTTVDATATASYGSFSDDDYYPAIFAGLWEATSQYKDQPAHHGYIFVLLVKDDKDKLIPFPGKFIRMEDRFNCFGEKTGFTKLMQGILGVNCYGAELQKLLVEKKFTQLEQLLGKGCAARMKLKKNDKTGKEYAYIDAITRPNEKRPCLSLDDVPDDFEIYPERVMGKIVNISDINDCAKINKIKICEGSYADSDEAVNHRAIEENTVDDVKDEFAIF